MGNKKNDNQGLWTPLLYRVDGVGWRLRLLDIRHLHNAECNSIKQHEGNLDQTNDRFARLLHIPTDLSSKAAIPATSFFTVPVVSEYFCWGVDCFHTSYSAAESALESVHLPRQIFHYAQSLRSSLLQPPVRLFHSIVSSKFDEFCHE